MKIVEKISSVIADHLKKTGEIPIHKWLEMEKITASFAPAVEREVLIAWASIQHIPKEIPPKEGYILAVKEFFDTVLGMTYQEGERRVKQLFFSLQQNKKHALAELKKINKRDLQDHIIKFPWSGGITANVLNFNANSKEWYMNYAYEQLLEALSRVNSKDAGKKLSLEEKVRAISEQDLETWIEDRTKEVVEAQIEELKTPEQRKQEGRARVEQEREDAFRLLVPKTVEDYERIIARSGGFEYASLKDIAKFDELKAAKVREQREKELEEKREQKEKYLKEKASRPIEQTSKAIIHEGKHSKYGHDIWTVVLTERLADEGFIAAIDNAKKLGGYYSSYRGKGAIPGFVFKQREPAEQFVALMSGEEKPQEVEEATIPFVEEDSIYGTAPDSLSKRAEALEGGAKEKIRNLADKKVNTAKRLGEYSRAYDSASSEIAEANTMRNIAQKMKEGEIKALWGVRSRVDVGLLTYLLALTKDNYVRAMTEGIKENYTQSVERDKQKAKPISDEMIKFAQYPYPTIHYKDLVDLYKQSEGIRGIRSERATIYSLMTYGFNYLPAHIDYKKIDNDREVRDIIEVTIAVKRKRPEIYQKASSGVIIIERRLQDYLRLKKMYIPDLETLRAALRELLPLVGKPVKRDAMKEKIAEVARKKIPGYFPTPQSIVDLMIDRAELSPGVTVLEPSAGAGHIADRIREIVGDENVDVIEYNYSLREILKEKGHRVVADNSLEYRVKYGAVLMNPPFENGQDIDHVRFAFDEQLQPGGRLVAIMSEGPFFRSDKKSVEFREWLDMHNGTSEELPEGAFKSSDRPTGVKTRLVVIDKER